MCRLYFSDLIKDVDVEKCVEEFLVRCDDAPDIDALREALYQMIDILKSKQPKYADNCVIHIGHIEDEDESYDYAYLLEKKDGQIYEYSFEAVPWDDVLGYALDMMEFQKYDNAYYAMLVIWEITWFGYDEETIQNKMKSMGFERCEEK